MRPALRQASTLLAHDVHASLPVAPPFVLACRAQIPTDYGTRRIPRPAYRFSTCRPRRQQSAVVAPSSTSDEIPPQSEHASRPASVRRSLPRTCPGCGAPAHTQEKNEAGFYNTDRHVVRNYLDGKTSQAVTMSEEDEIYAKALRDANPELLEQLGVENETAPEAEESQISQTPVCDRCHNLIHHRVGSEIHHPSIDAIQQTIAESPHRRNHIYHVIDAADFPLSIVPNLQSTLRIPKLRTQNRRAKHKGWVANDRIAEVSFIITRADLIAPKKEQVDAMMPYFKEVLRDALGRTNNKARLGNVRLVSAKRGWWTKQVKEDIWERGGAGWMVGKVNVGKSNLFEVVFPKGRGADYQDVHKIRSAAERDEMLNSAQSLDELVKVQQQLAKEDAETERLKNRPSTHLHQPPRELEEDQLEEEDFDDPDALLPPPQAYTPYPVLPVASSRPGTTASPIRIPFGRNRGELIDLPGLARTTPGLETFVRRNEHDSLVMKSRINSERFTLKPGQSLILGGGLIRITPTTQDLVFLVHPFVPIHPHVTRTEKAIDYQNQTSERQLQETPILTPNAGPKMASAGRFPLKWDVTKKLAGPVTSPVAGKMRPENLPFRIWSTDILVEGVGWIEVSAQTRRPQGWTPIGMAKKDPNHAAKAKLELAAREKARQQRKFDIRARAEREGVNAEYLLAEEMDKERLGDEMAEWEQEYPEVEVFSPLGKFVGQRRPMCASLVSGPKRIASRERKVRPRRSMVSVKRQRRPQGS